MHFTFSAWPRGSGNGGVGGINFFTLQQRQVCVNHLSILNKHCNNTKSSNLLNHR